MHSKNAPISALFCGSRGRDDVSPAALHFALGLMKVLIPSLVLLLLVAGCGKQQTEEGVVVPPGAPRAVLKAARQRDAQVLDDTLREYASQKGFRQCPVPHYDGGFYSGPGYPRVLYKDHRFAIWAWEQGPRGVFHLAPYTTNYTSQEFERFTNAVVMAVGRVLHVELNPPRFISPAPPHPPRSATNGLP